MGAGAGTRTFLFTDIEGSTRLWQERSEEMRSVLPRHDAILKAAVETRGGDLFKHTGDGICAAFTSASDAVGAAVEAQRQLLSIGSLAVRMGLHTGEPEHRDGDYFGPVLNRTARIMAVAHGGQILVSSVTAALLQEDMPEGSSLLDLGTHRLRDLANAERLHQVLGDGLRSDFPPLTSLEVVHNLPAQRTSFVGRARELADVLERLDSARLVTLTGIGGSGKTRLALEAAAEALARFPDGVAFVDLAPLGAGDLIESAVTAAVGLQRGGAAGAAGDARQDLLGFLARRTMLLVLDNCEHLLDDCADLVDAILDRAPEVTVLATSREALAVDGEHAVGVGSLPAGGIGDDAGRLFVDRAIAVDDRFDPEHHAEAITDICVRLDGIPLAIELAAAQVRHLTPEDIAARLDDRFDLLTGGRRRVPRQQTLEATLDWSHDLLDDEERAVLRRVAVFAGSFDLPSAEAVVTDERMAPAAIRRHLSSLVDKSLVASFDSEGRSRFRLLETVRLYALARLSDAGEATHVRDRHREHFLGRAEAVPAERRMFDVGALRTLRQDLENVRAALEWSHAQGRLDLVARQVGALVGMYWIYGLAEEAFAWAKVALEATDVAPDVAASVWVTEGLAAMMLGDFGELERAFATAADVAESATVRAGALGWLGFASMPDLDRALAILEQAREEIAGGAAEVSAYLSFLRGAVLLFHRRYEETIAVFSEIPLDLGFGSLPDLFVGGWRGIARLLAGRPREAVADFEAYHVFPGLWWEYSKPWCLALAHVALGDRDRAVTALTATVETLRRRPVALGQQELLLVCTAFSVAEGRWHDAARLLGSVRGSGPLLAVRSPASYAVYFHYRDLIFAALPAEEGRAAFRAGKTSDVELVVAEALARLL